MADTYKLPESARNNARRVLRWREEYGDEVKGMTEVGWRRARQLADNENVGIETVRAMSAFNRHRQNAEVAPEYKDEPWRDAGYVAWLGWGGTTGIDWARGITGATAKADDMADFLTVQAVKTDSGEWALDVRGVPFHHKDSDGEWFTPDTDIYAEQFPSPLVLYYHSYGPDGKPQGKPEIIGKTTTIEKRNDGWWYRVTLDKAKTLAQRIWDAAKNGLAAASSGSVSHLVRMKRGGQLVPYTQKGMGGEIAVWPVVELSLIDIGQGRAPANRYAVAVPVLKAVYAEAGLDLATLDDIADEETETNGDSIGDASAAEQRDEPADVEESAPAETESIKVEDITVSEIDLGKAVNEAVTAALAERERQEEERRKNEAAVKAQVDAAVEAAKAETQERIKQLEAEAAANRRLPGGGAPYVSQFNNTSKYDDLDAGDLSVLFAVAEAAKTANRGRGASEDLRRALAIRIADSSEGNEDFVASKSAMKMAGMPIKANELNQSTLSGFGDQWIGVTYSTQLWDKIRLATNVVSRIPTVTVPQGSESIVIPVGSTSPTFYKVAQASAQAANPGAITQTVTTSKLATTNQTLNVSKLGAAVIYTRELEEDSLIPWASELRRDLTLEAAEVLEHIVIDGDTDTSGTTNINDIGGTPAGSEAFLLFNGFRKLALVTNTANSRDGGTLAIEDFLETVKLMGLGGRNAYDRNMVSCIVDMATYWKTHELNEMKSKDFNNGSTTVGYNLLTPWGYEVIGSPNMHRANQDATYGLKANSAGKIDLDTASNNTKGAILSVRWDQWRFGYKRMMTFEIEREPRADATAIIVMMRAGLINRDNEASAISYNLTV